MDLPHQLIKVKVTKAHVRRIEIGQRREKLKESMRSPKWTALRNKILKKHTTCAACGSILGLQVHHIQPFHLHPNLELEVNNLIVLCLHVGGLECHLKLGHGGDYKHYNPNVVADCLNVWNDHKAWKDICNEAKKGRLI